MEKDILELQIECPGIGDNGEFFMEHTGRGTDISPEFLIKNLSPKAKTLAITLEDLSHPIRGFTHWVIWNIPAAARIEKGIPAGRIVPSRKNAAQGIGYGFHRYAGPKPPKGKTHLYRFTLYALDRELKLGVCAGKRRFLRKAEGYIMQKGSVTGKMTG